jgi:hypothetical protein
VAGGNLLGPTSGIHINIGSSNGGGDGSGIRTGIGSGIGSGSCSGGFGLEPAAAAAAAL